MLCLKFKSPSVYMPRPQRTCPVFVADVFLASIFAVHFVIVDSFTICEMEQKTESHKREDELFDPFRRRGEKRAHDCCHGYIPCANKY